MIASGLVPELTLEAAKRAALGAGANLIKTFSYELSHEDVNQIEALRPDIILLCGGTDGGNKDIVIQNAAELSKSSITAPVIYAGDRAAATQCRSILEKHRKEVIVTENVMPRLGALNVDNVRSAIRNVFITKIVTAKGLRRAEKFVDSILMPTPAAVLKAAELIANGFGHDDGRGEVVVVDVGGATTDVHSVGYGTVYPGAIKKGMPEPYSKRTVEGDLGVRHNIMSIISAMGREKLLSYLGNNINYFDKYALSIREATDSLPTNKKEQEMDAIIACGAIEIAIDRHVGTLEMLHLPFGDTLIQEGKNLTNFKILIGTGGPIVNGNNSSRILKKALLGKEQAFSLRPPNPAIFLDERYMLYAIGLLSEISPKTALGIANKYLKEITDCAKRAN